MHGLRETAPPGPYFPFHRDETYPRTLCVNFKRLEYRTLQKYCKLHAINVRPDCTQAELAVAAARHFQEAPAVDEEGVMMSFLQQVIVPDRPFRPKIDLNLARMGGLRNGDLEAGGGGGGGGGPGVMPLSAAAAVGAYELGNGGGSADNGGMDDQGDLDDGDEEDVEDDMMIVGGVGMGRGGGERDGGGRGLYSGGGGGGGGYGGYGRNGGHGHGHSPGMGSGGYDEKPPRMGAGGDWSRGVGGRDGAGGGGGGGYGHDLEYGRASHQMSSAWEQEEHGGDMIPKLGKRSGSGGGGGRGRNVRGTSASNSAPAHGSLPVMTDRGGMPMSGGGDDGTKGRKHKIERGGGGGGGVGESGSAKAPIAKKSRKGTAGWRAKNGEQVAVRDDRDSPGAWILARVIKYVPETHQYELKDDDDKEGIGILTAPRSLVIRLEDSTKGVQRGERVLAVFPDTTSFYLGTVHRVLKPVPGAERCIEVKFNDDADENGRTPGRPLPARYVVPIPEGFEEDGSKPAEMDDDDDDEPAADGGGGRGGGGGGGGGEEEEAEDGMGGEDDDAGEIPYADMIRAALMKLPGRQGNLPAVCAYIEEHFHDRLNWRSESSLRRTPKWKASVRRTLAHHHSFCHAGTPERNVYTLVD